MRVTSELAEAIHFWDDEQGALETLELASPRAWTLGLQDGQVSKVRFSQ